jgi:hypothetical protein
LSFSRGFLAILYVFCSSWKHTHSLTWMTWREGGERGSAVRCELIES